MIEIERSHADRAGVRGSRLPKLMLSLGAVVLTILPFEIWARHRFDREHARLADVDTTTNVAGRAFDFADLIRPSEHDDIVFELRPNLEGTFLGAPYRSNEHGFRDRSMPQSKPNDEFRIALLGDSLAFGWGVAAEHSMGEVLERRLQEDPRKPPAVRVEVMNFGVPAYNTAQEAALLEHRALAFDPDLVLVQYYYNDFYLPGFLLDRPEKPWFCFGAWLGARIRGGEQASSSLVVPSRDGELRDSAVAEWRKQVHLVPPEYAHMVGAQGVKRALERILRVATSRGIPVLGFVITIPTQPRIDSGDPIDPDTISDPEFDSIAREVGIPFFPTEACLIERLREIRAPVTSIVLSPSDWHFNVPGNRWVGEHLADRLSSHVAARIAEVERRRGQ